MGRERHIVIAILAVGAILGAALWFGISRRESPGLEGGPREPRPSHLPSEAFPKGAMPRRRVKIETIPFEAETPSARPAGPTVVTGRVWDVTGELAIGARMGLGRSVIEEGEETVATWTELWSDCDGQYTFTAEAGWCVRLWADSSSSTVTLLPAFEVRAGENRVEDIHLCAGATVSGCVRDETGMPIGNTILLIETFFHGAAAPAELRPLSLLPGSLDSLFKKHVATDEGGNYCVTDLHPSCRVRISVHHPKLVARQGVLEVRAGDGVVDFDLEPSTLTRIRGRVEGVDEADLGRIKIQVRDGPPWARRQPSPPVESTGAFEIQLRDGFKGTIRAVSPDGRYLPSDDHEIHVLRGEVCESIRLFLQRR